MQHTPLKNCIACSKVIKGRIDKKFCNDYCRNGYNNQLKSAANNYVRNINNRLSKNRRILENILGEKDSMIKLKKEYMMQLGFSFNLTTQIHKNKLGAHYFYCYEYGYMPLDNEWCVIIKNEYM